MWYEYTMILLSRTCRVTLMKLCWQKLRISVTLWVTTLFWKWLSAWEMQLLISTRCAAVAIPVQAQCAYISQRDFYMSELCWFKTLVINCCHDCFANSLSNCIMVHYIPQCWYVGLSESQYGEERRVTRRVSTQFCCYSLQLDKNCNGRYRSRNTEKVRVAEE